MRKLGQWMVKLKLNGKEIMGREIVLPMPPSENQRLEVNWRKAKEVVYGSYTSSSRGRSYSGAVHNTKAYNQWKSAAIHLLRAGKLPIIEGEVVVFVTLVFPDRQRRDADNRMKALFDAFTQCEALIEDDSLIVMHTVNRRIIKGSSFCVAHLVPKDSIGHLGFEIDDSYLEARAEDMRTAYDNSTTRLA